MTSNDIKGLIDDARCINNCIPPGYQLPALIALLFDASSGAVAPCVNLIPNGAVYDGNGNYNVSAMVAGKAYTVTLKASDTVLVLQPDGTPSLVYGPGTFPFTPGATSSNSAILNGTPLASVTATICAA